MTVIPNKIPKSERELEQFYRDLTVKVGGTTSTLSDEEQKSSIPVIGMIQAVDRRLDALARDNRRLKVEVSQLQERVKTLEGEL